MEYENCVRWVNDGAHATARPAHISRDREEFDPLSAIAKDVCMSVCVCVRACGGDCTSPVHGT